MFVPTTNTYHKILFIKGASYGTAFCIEVDDREYLVSAKHLFADPANTVSIKYLKADKWIDLAVKTAWYGRNGCDAIAFALDNQISLSRFPLIPSTEGMAWGQEVCFLGYPFQMSVQLGSALADRPFPFVKRGNISAWLKEYDDTEIIFVDAINNEGFSGGPVIFQPHDQKHPQVCGIVSGYRTDSEPVLDDKGEQTGHTVQYNTGFLRAMSIDPVVKGIKRNPIGFRFPS